MTEDQSKAPRIFFLSLREQIKVNGTYYVLESSATIGYPPPRWTRVIEFAAYGTLQADKDKEIVNLKGARDELWNKFQEICTMYTEEGQAHSDECDRHSETNRILAMRLQVAVEALSRICHEDEGADYCTYYERYMPDGTIIPTQSQVAEMALAKIRGGGE